MLESLKIKNFVLIPELDISFNDGMSVITGETGSGKSILLSAISMLLGAKADKSEIREGEDKAELEAVFYTKRKSLLNYLESKDIETEDGKVIIRRIIKSNGRSSYSVNGTSITLAEGFEIGRLLVDITSQNSSMDLKKSDMQRLLIDCDEDIEHALYEYQESYRELIDLEKSQKELKDKIARLEEDRSYLEFSLNELDKADLKIGEDDEIKERLKIAQNAESLVDNLTEAKNALDSSSRSLSAALSYLDKAKTKDDSLIEYYDRLESCSIEADDILSSISAKISSYSFDEYEMEELNSRLALLQRIRKKYGGSIEEAIKRRDEIKISLELSDNSFEELGKIEKAIERQSSLAMELALKLSKKRQRRAENLSKDITKSLQELSMEGSRFIIRIEKTDLGLYGLDKITFLIKANKGEKESLLENAASGGELSRIMLAIKSNLHRSDDTETLIFDEIDTGISGHAASNVASVLKTISKNTQIIAITHLAQIARCADSHILVKKREEKGRTISALSYISGEARIKEIARLLSGDDSEISIAHAASLIG